MMLRRGSLPAALAEIERQLRSIQDQIRRATSGIELDRFGEAVASLHDQARHIGEAGWTIPMWATPREISDIMQQASLEDIDGVFLRYYESDGGVHYQYLRDSLLGKETLDRWRDLIQQCFDALDQDLTLVVVPAMMTVIEGAIASSGGEKAWRRSNPKQTAAELAAHSTDSPIRRAIWTSISHFVLNLFEPHSFSGERPTRINRHWILHGRDEPKWTRVDCLRLFQAADTIAA